MNYNDLYILYYQIQDILNYYPGGSITLHSLEDKIKKEYSNSIGFLKYDTQLFWTNFFIIFPEFTCINNQSIIFTKHKEIYMHVEMILHTFINIKHCIVMNYVINVLKNNPNALLQIHDLWKIFDVNWPTILDEMNIKKETTLCCPDILLYYNEHVIISDNKNYVKLNMSSDWNFFNVRSLILQNHLYKLIYYIRISIAKLKNSMLNIDISILLLKLAIEYTSIDLIISGLWKF